MSIVPRAISALGSCVLLLAVTPGHPTQWTQQPSRTGSLQWIGSGAPLSFEENRGQFEGPARFMAAGPAFTLSLEPAGVLMNLARPDGPDADGQPIAVRMALVGGSARTRPQGRDELPGLSHYLRGSDPSGWVRDVPSYANVVYERVYPGIDLVFRGDGERFEYDFVVDAGADPGRIRLAFEGIERARLDEDGDLVLETQAGEVRQHRPRLYEEAPGGRLEVAGGFALMGPREVGFQVGSHDTGRPLVIDPELIYSTYHGGCRGRQGILDLAFDTDGSAYVAGYYPWDCDRGDSELFVSKFSSTGERVFRTNMGGQYYEEPRGIALDAAGNIYLTGATSSTSCCRPFPVVNPFQPVNAGGANDAFVMKLDPSGRTILYSTFLGGSGDDRGADIDVDANGLIYVTGRTTSTNFPIESAWQPALAGGSDAFLTVFDPTGSKLVFSTYLGGIGDETVARLALSPLGPLIVGTTSSLDFPTRSGDPAGPLQPVYGGGATDAFLATLSPSGSLQDATYLGGSGQDEAYGVAQGPGFAWVTGSTDSSDFRTASPLQPSLSHPPEADAFVAKVSDTLSSLAYSTYLEASGAVTCPLLLAGGRPCGAVSVDAGGNAFVTSRGIFVAKIDPAGTSRLYTFNGYGGQAIAVRDTQPPDIFVAGFTQYYFPLPTLNAFQSSHRWYETEVGWLTSLADVPNPGAVFEENDQRIAYTGTWEMRFSPELSGGAAIRSMETGAKAVITFTGTGIQVIGRRDSAAGTLKVSPSWDHSFPYYPLDTYASPAEPLSLLVSYSDLPLATYTLTLEVDGTQSSRSSGAWVSIDGFNVLGAPAPGPTSAPRGRPRSPVYEPGSGSR